MSTYTIVRVYKRSSNRNYLSTDLNCNAYVANEVFKMSVSRHKRLPIGGSIRSIWLVDPDGKAVGYYQF